MCWPWWTLHWCQEWDLLVMSTRTHATVRMEEQIALLIQKLDEQCQQIKCLGESQSTQLKEMEWRLYQMENRVNSLMEELETLQQKMWLKQKQDSETDTLAQPQTFSGYSGQFQQPMPPRYPVVYVQVAIWAVTKTNHWGEQDRAAHWSSVKGTSHSYSGEVLQVYRPFTKGYP